MLKAGWEETSPSSPDRFALAERLRFRYNYSWRQYLMLENPEAAPRSAPRRLRYAFHLASSHDLRRGLMPQSGLRPGRPEAIRRLIEFGLEAAKSGPG
jgi:hypothetical protein